MTAETGPGPAWTTPGGLAEPGSTRRANLNQRMVRSGIVIAVLTHTLGDRRFQATVITGALGAYALASLIKNNQARPMRRTAAWYKKLGEPKELQRVRRALESGKR